MQANITGIDWRELETLSKMAERVRLSPNQLVFAQGDPTRHFYLLERGCVRVYYNSWNGREITFFNCRAGDLFGLAEAISLWPRSASAQATEPSVAWAIASSGLPDIARHAPNFMLRLAEGMSLRLHSVAVLMESVVAVPLRVRVASYLLASVKSRTGKAVLLASEGLTHETMANVLGCSRQTLTKVLNEFARGGFIRIQRKRIMMLDPMGLRKHSEMATFGL